MEQEHYIWSRLDWHPSKEQLDIFTSLQDLLIHWNKKVNLTRLLEGNDYWIGQVLDSLLPLKEELQRPALARKCIDIGTGCGFPGFAAAIALPGLKLTMVDAHSRKTKILKAICSELGLSSQINVITERIEITGQNIQYRSNFDIAMARAVASAPIVAEYLIPFLNTNGTAILYKGKWSHEEEKQLHKALIHLKAEVKGIEQVHLPEDRGIRHLVRLTTNEKCPKTFPRSIGIPAKRPLGGT